MTSTPSPPEAIDGWTDKPGEGYWRDRHHDPSPGWSDDDKQRETELRERTLDLATQVHGHPHWDTLRGADLVKARMKIKHMDDESVGD
ncbi:hypothetical protein [Streptomyces sp. YGL11-2]|uniref:hypothetical protein n=1 Tax=Streptomyces sp. YGL11-2 TaxID=3414028 RepID=UPI003CEAFCCE